MSPAANMSETEETQPSPNDDASNHTDFEAKIVCEGCGKEADRLHLGCPFCEDCCDCRPG